MCVCAHAYECVSQQTYWLDECLCPIFLRKGKHESNDTVQISFFRLGELALKWQFWGELVGFTVLYWERFGRKEGLYTHSSQRIMLLFLCLCRNQSSSPVASGRNMLAKRKTALPRKRRKLPQEMSLSVLKKVGRSSSASRVILTSADEVFLPFKSGTIHDKHERQPTHQQ